jgi:hypothetical protein
MTLALVGARRDLAGSARGEKHVAHGELADTRFRARAVLAPTASGVTACVRYRLHDRWSDDCCSRACNFARPASSWLARPGVEQWLRVRYPRKGGTRPTIGLRPFYDESRSASAALRRSRILIAARCPSLPHRRRCGRVAWTRSATAAHNARVGLFLSTRSWQVSKVLTSVLLGLASFDVGVADELREPLIGGEAFVDSGVDDSS